MSCTQVRNAPAAIDTVRQRNVSYLLSMLGGESLDANLLQDNNGRTLLMVAAAEGEKQVVEFLCGIRGIYQVNVNMQDYQGESAIYHAAAAGWLDIVQVLMRAWALVDIENKLKFTPLMIAAYNGHANVCTELLVTGHANVNHADITGKTALVLATLKGHITCIKVLLEHGADINAQDQDGWTALMFATSLGRRSASRLLATSGADRSIRNPIHKDAHAGYSAFVDMIEGNAEVPTSILQSLRNLDSPRLAYGMPLQLRPAVFQPQGESSKPHHHVQSRPNFSVLLRSPSLPDHGLPTLKVSTCFGDIPTQNPDHFSINASSRRIPKPNPTISRENLLSENPRRFSHRRVLSRRHEREQPGDQRDPDAEMMALLSPAKKYTAWTVFAMVLTCLFPPILLQAMGKKDPESQQAWREKCALCFIIAFVSAILGFMCFGPKWACGNENLIYPYVVSAAFGSGVAGTKLMIVRGRLYDVTDFFKSGLHGPIFPYTEQQLAPIINQLYGQDISNLFPVNTKTIECPFTPSSNDLSSECNQGGDPRYHCHISDNANRILKSLSYGNTWVAFTWDNVTQGDGGRKLIIYNDNVFDVGNYLRLPSNHLYLGADAQQRAEIRQWLNSSVGKDITFDVRHNADRGALIPCFEDQFLVGKIDGSGVLCFMTNISLAFELIVLISVMLVKTISAISFLFFSYSMGRTIHKPHSNALTSYVILFTTCYSEGEVTMRTALDSLAAADYSDQRKLLFVVADGEITGKGERRSTPDICKSLMEMQFPNEPQTQIYDTVGIGYKTYNVAKVYSGWYNYQDHRVPMLLIRKCGTPAEQNLPKPGNRGKRDSQLILMKWLQKVTLDEDMMPLEFDISRKVCRLVGVTPNTYSLALMMDADSFIKPDALALMVSAMERDPKVIGLCGETRIANKTKSLTTMIQVFEYFISDHFGRSFESVFGCVTCLPGCLCMYRIKVPKNGGHVIPILASPKIVRMYSSNTVDTLHKKNLFLLGEDRFLTMLMLRTFPKRKLIYIPKAVCKTIVPDNIRVLLSQRRRWINSTVHNLLELLLVPQLCGFFCFSLHFVLLFDLIATIALPATLCLMIVLILLGVLLHVNITVNLLLSAALLFGPALCAMCITRKLEFGMWMMIYMFALPIWNFVIPVYAYWHFDDFTWV